MSSKQPSGSMVIDAELACVLDRVCEQCGLEDREQALNMLLQRRINGSLKGAIVGGPKRPELTVIKGGKQ
ncbi:hypothetical protein R84981_001143 [Carnimonas sp. R-84981]|uniref:hypothetical protein n=1 Tax=Carnimonas bestiolae TaxID=3402172 RepID=UPI003EDB821B